MKKALLVIGLALCTTATFAQTQRFNQKVNMNARPTLKADYKASIFTKDDSDTLGSFDFAPTHMTGIIYEAAGNITAANGNNIIDGAAAEFNHLNQNPACSWNRIPDSVYMESEEFAEAYNLYYDGGWYDGWINYYMGSRYTGDDNGFMFLSLLEAGTAPSQSVHTSFTLPAVANHDGVAIIDVTCWQFMRKFNNDKEYVDYMINGQWKSNEVNVKNVDVGVNDHRLGNVTFTMPLELASQDSIKVRFRCSTNSPAGGAYGYYWAVDNVKIIAGSADRWKRFDEYYLDGAYGMMPQGMQIPLTWYSTVANNGTNDRNSVATVLSHSEGDAAFTTVKTISQNNLPAGNPSATFKVAINEREYLCPEFFADSVHQAWWGFSQYYGTTNVPQNYASLPSDNLGKHRVTVTGTSTGAADLEWDTIRYDVVDMTGNEANLGYRWAHDNGIIPARSSYIHGYNVESDGETYIVDSGHYTDAGYTMALRYTTGSELPTVNGQPWALLGIEIVPSTKDWDYDYMEDVEISPVAWTLAWSEDGSEFEDLYNVPTGFPSSRNYVISESDINYLASGYLTTEDYKAIRIMFPNQPLLEPNTSYYLGYTMEQNGYFAPAATRYSYYDGSSYVNYLRDEALADYYDQFSASAWDLYLYDPIANSASLWMANSFTEYPMIRAIVGPQIPRDTYRVYGYCESEDDAALITNVSQNVNLCGENETNFEGASPLYYLIPQGDHGYIDQIYIDDVLYDEENPDPTANYFVEMHENHVMNPEDDSEVALWRYYYTVEFEDIDANHTLKVVSSNHDWSLGIDPVASECALGVTPNPATSQVKVSLNGVTGTVNCSIIDMSGREVYSTDYNAENALYVDLNGFARGAYFVRVTNGTFSKIEKLIVR